MNHLKIALFTFNFIIWLTGCVVFIIGIWLLFEPGKGELLNLFIYDDSPHESVNLIAYILLALGLLVIAVAFWGCRVPSYRNHYALATYISMLTALMITELVTAAIGGFMSHRLIINLEDRLRRKLINDYGQEASTDFAFTSSFDYAQYTFNCCGIYGDDDYNATQWWKANRVSGYKKQVPLTCCVLKNAEELKNTGSPMSVISRVLHRNHQKPWLTPQPSDEVACQTSENANAGFRYKEGCLEKMINWLQCGSRNLVFLAVGMAGIQIFGMITSVFLYCTLMNSRGD